MIVIWRERVWVFKSRGVFIIREWEDLCGGVIGDIKVGDEKNLSIYVGSMGLYYIV